MNALVSIRFVVKGLLSALLLLVLGSCSDETVEKLRTSGYKAKARANAFLAAQRLIQKQGREVDNDIGRLELNDAVATIMVPPSYLNSVVRAKRVITWAENGGHLVVMMAGGNRRGNDFNPLHMSGYKADEELSPGMVYLLRHLTVEIVDWPRKKDKLLEEVNDRDKWEAMDEADRVLIGSEPVQYALGPEEMQICHWSDHGFKSMIIDPADYGGSMVDGQYRHRYLSLVRGEGRVSLLADARPLRNRYIGYADHAAFVGALVDLSRDGKVVFIDGSGVGFLAMVWDYFWMAVIGLLAVIVFWLWKNLPVFGPRQGLPQTEVREFTEQLLGVGRFLWRHKRDDAMLASLRRRVEARLVLDPSHESDKYFDQLAEKSGLSRAAVIEAMTRNNTREPGVMVRVVKNLQHMLKFIN